MLGKIRKMLNQKGFTLIELMTVLVILGVILGIGVPRYLKIQAKAEWDADATTIENIARTAEVYAAQKNSYSNLPIKGTLIAKGLVDGNMVLNRKKSGTSSIKNEDNTTLNTMLNTDMSFTFDQNSGRVTNLDTIITNLIGPSPY